MFWPANSAPPQTHLGVSCLEVALNWSYEGEEKILEKNNISDYKVNIS